MYRLIKSYGTDQPIIILNNSTSTNLIVGALNSTRRNIIEEINIEIDSITASKLSTTAMPIKKPIRDQRKCVLEEKAKAKRREQNKNINALDVLLGKADYV